MGFVKNPNDIVDDYVNDHLAVFQDNLQAIMMYGSAVTHEFIPGKSDVNMAIVVKNFELNELMAVKNIQKKWCKRGVATPFYLTKELIESSSNVFPLEMLDMKGNYRVLQGTDFLELIEINKDDVFKQCLREIKSQSIQIRRAVIKVAGKEKDLKSIADSSIKALIPVFKGVVFLFNEPTPNSKSEIVAKVEDLLNLGASSFSEVFNIANSVKKTDIKELLVKYCSDLDKISALIESIINDLNLKDVQAADNFAV